LVHVMQLFDLSAITGSVLLAAVTYSRRMSFQFSDMLSARLKVSNFILIIVLLGACHVILRANGLYTSRRLSTRKAEVNDIMKAITICALLFAASAVAFRIEIVNSRSFLTAFWVISTLTLVGSRMALRGALVQLR